MPYVGANVEEVFASGGDLNDVWQTSFFAEIRAWQRAYGYRENGEPCPERVGNWLAPCLIRDHHADFRRIVEKTFLGEKVDYQIELDGHSLNVTSYDPFLHDTFALSQTVGIVLPEQAIKVLANG